MNRSPRHILLMIVLLVMLAPFSSLQAQGSAACAILDDGQTVISSDWTFPIGTPLQAGDRVSVGVTPAEGGSIQTLMEIPVSNTVASGVAPTVLSYVVKNDGPSNVRIWASGTVEIDWSCSAASEGEDGGSSKGFARPPDDRLNFRQCDSWAAVYAEKDVAGGPALHVYPIDSGGQGTFAFAIAGADLTPYVEQNPAENTLIKAADGAALYALASGGFQLTLGPDAEGKLCSLFFEGLAFTNLHTQTSFGPNAAAPAVTLSKFCLTRCQSEGG